MEPILFAGLYILVLITFVFVMLFGESELFANTPVASAHAFINGGACSQIEWCAAKLCGESGRQGLAGLETACCERSNPLVQLLFLAMLAGAYYLYLRDVFPMLPLPGLPSWHKWTGSAVLGICFAFFLTASLSDPGYVTPDNVDAHCRLYPPDGVLFAPDAKCWTCGVAKPARSKHCKTCGRCVARFDHHCVWVNNCVGLLNMRWFLAFLLSTAAVCAYGAVLAALAIRADMRRRDAWSVAYVDRETGRLVYVGDSWRVALGYIVSRYSSQVALVVFLGLAGWIVFGFWAYQLLRILQGVTTNESFKRREHLRAAALQRRLDAERAKQDAITERILAGGGAVHIAAGEGRLQAGESASGKSENGGETGMHGTHNFQGSSKAQLWSFWHWGRQQPPQQEQQQQQQRAQGIAAATLVGGHAASEAGGGSRAGLAPLPPNMYDRGAIRNVAEVLFPHHYLCQAAAEVKAD